MTPFREQLDQAKREYQQARYRGDLSRELLPARRGIVGIVGVLASCSAIAASVALWMNNGATLVPTTPARTVALATTTEAIQEVNFSEIPAMPSLPSMDLSPSNIELAIPAMPAMPALNELETTTSATTQESV